MFGIDDATAVAVMPTPEAAGTPGYFTEGNPGLGQAATYVRASFLNALQTELLNILTAAGVTPTKTVYDQLLTGLRSNALITGNATGAANTYAVAYTPAITALVDGMVLWFKASATNTGASTLNINAVGAKAIVGGAHAALQGGEILANGRCLVVWNTALNSFVLIECTGGAIQVGAATQSQHAMQLGQAAGRLIGVQTISATGSYTPTAGTNSIIVEGVGGGGGGAGAPATGGATAAIGGGGSAGSYFKVLIRTGFSGATVTIGTAGAGNSGANGGTGGATSFGAFATAPGGIGAAVSGLVAPPLVAGGAPSPLIATASPGVGGVSILLMRGYQGQHGVFAANGNGLSGAGGFSLFGPGGSSSINGGGNAGLNPGSGGSGGLNNFSSAANAGGAGVAGQVIVWEFS